MREPTEMELRVVEAMKKANPLLITHEMLFPTIDMARAAIRAMRDPTQAVLDDGEMAYIESIDEFTIRGPGIVIGRDEDDSCVREAFNAMIDAASPPEENS